MHTSIIKDYSILEISAMLGSFVIFSLLLCHVCHGNKPTCGSCSNSVVVLTKDELKSEIRAELVEVIAKECQQQISGNYTHTSINELVNAVQEIGHNLTELTNELETLLLPTMNKLMTLHRPGMTASHPATSCSEIFNFNRQTPSGYYWLEASSGSAVRMYCDMTLSCKGVGGGWMQVAKLDMTNSSHQCPPGTRLRTYTYQSKRLCGKGITSVGCSSTTFSAHGIKYNQVCGKIIAYQFNSPDAFFSTLNRHLTIDQNYVDGISLTHGHNPRKHIWTFAAALDEVGTHPNCNCRCTNTGIRQTGSLPPPSFVGNDYFCDTGSIHRYRGILYHDDPLWDGDGCGQHNTCCSLNNPPWFYKSLPSTTHDAIEMRMCTNELVVNEDTPIEIIELYVK